MIIGSQITLKYQMFYQFAYNKGLEQVSKSLKK